MPTHGPVVPRRRLGDELRRLREEAGLLLEDVAAQLECSTSKISRLETGKGIPRARDVRDMLDAYGVSDRAVRDRLMRWVREGQQQGWWSEFSDVLQPDTLVPGFLDRFLALESDATAIMEFQQSVVPGLLQTRAYAHAVISLFYERFDPAQVDRLVEVRLQRETGLTRGESPQRFHAVIDEGVLRREVGGAEVMRGQLRALLRTARRRNVSIQVLPFSAGLQLAAAGSFSVFQYEDAADRDVVILESHKGITYLEGESDVALYEQIFAAARREALTVNESAEVIGTLADQMR